jgi:hypothetical protein
MSPFPKSNKCVDMSLLIWYNRGMEKFPNRTFCNKGDQKIFGEFITNGHVPTFTKKITKGELPTYRNFLGKKITNEDLPTFKDFL